MKNIRLVIPYWSLGLGGIQTRIVAIVEAILFFYKDAEIFILVKRKTDQDFKLRENKNLEVLYFSEAIYFGEKLGFAIWLLKTIWILKPTHILTFLNRFSLIAVISKFLLFFKNKSPKVILSEEIYTSNYIKQNESFYWKIIVSATYRFADKIFVLTNIMQHDLINNFFIPKNIIEVLPSWVPRQSCKKVRKEFSAIYVGRLAKEKRVSIVLDLAIKIKQLGLNHKILIVGDGVLKDKIIKEIKNNKLSSVVEYTGYRKDTLNLMSKSKLLLLPSENEGLPMVILESNSVGIPAAVTPFKGSEELINNDKNGWIFSDDKYIDGVIDLLSDGEKLHSVGKTSLLNSREKYSFRNLITFVRRMLV